MAIFLVFLLGYGLSQFFRTFLAVIAPELARELAIGPSELGTMSAAWFAAFAFAQFPVGWALDRFGPRHTVPVTLVIAAAGAGLLASAGRFAHCVPAMALIGVGCSAVFMGALYMFGRTYPPQRFAFLTSWLIGLGSAGNLLAASPLAWAAETFGWRLAIASIGAVALVSAGLVARVVRDPPRLAQAAGTRSLLGGIGEVVRIRALWPLLPLVAVSYAVIAAERALWVGPYLAEVHGLAPLERGHAVLAMAAAMSLGALLYGPLDQLLGTRKWVVVAGSLVTAAGFVFLWWVAAPRLGVAIAMLAVIGAAAHTYGVLMAHGRQFFPDHLLGRGITFLNFLFIGGTGLLQYASGQFVGLLKAGGLAAPAVFAALHLAFGLLLLAAMLVYLGSRERR